MVWILVLLKKLIAETYVHRALYNLGMKVFLRFEGFNLWSDIHVSPETSRSSTKIGVARYQVSGVVGMILQWSKITELVPYHSQTKLWYVWKVVKPRSHTCAPLFVYMCTNQLNKLWIMTVYSHVSWHAAILDILRIYSIKINGIR